MTPLASTPQLLPFAVLVLLLLFGSRGVGQVWRGTLPDKVLAMWRTLWPWSEAALRGYVRSAIALSLAGWTLAVAYGLDLFLGEVSGQASNLVDVLIDAALVGTFLLLTAVVLVVLVNRPKFFVPPWMRDDEGLLETWRRNRRTPPP